MFVLEKGGFQVLNIYLYDLLLKKKKIGMPETWMVQNHQNISTSFKYVKSSTHKEPNYHP